MPEQPATPVSHDPAIIPWYIAAGDDGLHKDCIMVAVMQGREIQSISLHLAAQPEATPPL